jgi:hypothetical protein
MERVWQALWDRFGHRYSWVVFAVTVVAQVQVFATAALVMLAFEDRGSRASAVGATVVVNVATVWLAVRPGPPAGLVDRGDRALKGKAASTRVFAVSRGA